MEMSRLFGCKRQRIRVKRVSDNGNNCRGSKEFSSLLIKLCACQEQGGSVDGGNKKLDVNVSLLLLGLCLYLFIL